MEAHMFILTLIRKIRQRQQLMGSMGWMLQRGDDHFLLDIGLSREDLMAMLRDPDHPVGSRKPVSFRRLVRA